MGLTITDPDIEKLARAYAAELGVSVPEAVRRALEQAQTSMAAAGSAATKEQRRRCIEEVQRRVREFGPPDMSKTEDEILGYDEQGLPE